MLKDWLGSEGLGAELKDLRDDAAARVLDSGSVGGAGVYKIVPEYLSQSSSRHFEMSLIARWIDSTVPCTSTMRSVDCGRSSLDATILTPEVSWICLILMPCLPMTVPMRLWEMRSLIAVVADGGDGSGADAGFKGLSRIV